MNKIKTLSAIMLILLMATEACRHDAVAPQQTVYFPQVRNIIQANCVVCHSPGGQGTPLFLTTDDEIAANASGIKSATCDPVSPFNKRMPQGGELSDEDKNIITQWYEKGGRVTD